MKRLARWTFGLCVALVVASCGSPAAEESPRLAPSPRSSSAVLHEVDRVRELAFQGGDFYDVPEPLAAGDRGALIRLQTLQDNEIARVYRILYHSTSVDSSDVAVSGTIWVPAGRPPPGGFPIVAWAPGNNGSGDPCAYSAAGDVTRIDYALLMFQLIKEGYVVAYTDYEGHGTRYPYLFAVPESSTRSLIDAARAARDLLGVVASDLVVIAGHSLGAGAAAASLQHGPEYAGELDVRGALVLEGGADVVDTVADTMAGGDPVGVVQGVVGWAAAYPELDPADVLTPDALRGSRSIETSCDAASAFDGRPTVDIFAADPLDVPSWEAWIEASTVRQAPFPAFFVVAPTSARHVEEIRTVTERLCLVSAAVRFETYPGADHDSVIEIAGRDYFAWIADRFAGELPMGNCGSDELVVANGASQREGRPS